MAETNQTHPSGPEDLPYLLTVEQIADLVSIGTTLVHQKTKLFLDSGGVAVDGIPAVRIGRCKRVPRDRLLEWIDHGCMNIPSERRRTSWLRVGARTTTTLLVRPARGARATARAATAVPSRVRSSVTPSDASPLSTRTPRHAAAPVKFVTRVDVGYRLVTARSGLCCPVRSARARLSRRSCRDG